tara:strand:- start:9419 stop:10420 length:1002 start_codon:yes stop_codon:yes gene_type:complete
MGTSQQQAPACPKCGYDQSGEIATWQEHCPMRGLCPECGYEFSWSAVFSPLKFNLLWYVEHALSLRSMMRRTLSTLGHLLIPHRYWRRVEMESPRSLKRFAVWVILLALAMHLLTTAGFTAGEYAQLVRYNKAVVAANAPGSTAQPWMMGQALRITSVREFWAPTIMDAVLFQGSGRVFYYRWGSNLMIALGWGMVSTSAVWFLMFTAFSPTRRRSKLRMIHVYRALVVSSLMCVLLFEIGRMIDMLYDVSDDLIGIRLGRGFLRFVFVLFPIAVGIWIQWFWVSAALIGWKIEAKFYEMLMVVIASFLGAAIVFLVYIMSGRIGYFQPLLRY